MLHRVARQFGEALESHRPRLRPLRWWWVGASAVFVCCVGVGLGWWLWAQAGGLRGAELAQAKTEAIRTALTAAAATGAALALLLAVRRQRSTEVALGLQDEDLRQKERVAEDAGHDAAERRITDLYTKAVEQLGSDKAPVRLGGLYALERLAQDHQSHRQTIVDVICAYLRIPDSQEENLPERQVRLTAQRILMAHLRSKFDEHGELSNPKFWPNIDLDLAGARLFALNLKSCHLRHANFGSATFDGSAVFERTRFSGHVSFRATVFTRDALFTKTKLATYADFRATQFGGEARFTKTRFGGYADFRGATFASTATFERTVLTKGIGLGAAQARVDVELVSTWPPGWTMQQSTDGDHEWCHLVRTGDPDATAPSAPR